MKGIYLVAILYVATMSVAYNESPMADILTKCHDTNPLNEIIFISHESDCTKFYSCHMGKKGKPLDCPIMDKNGNRLHFNPKLQVCDWPLSAGCQISSSTTLSSRIPTSITNPSSSSMPTTSTSSTPTPTTSIPSFSTPTTSTISTSSSPTPTTPTPSFSMSTVPTTSTPSSPTPTTLTSSSPKPTTPTPSSLTPTTRISNFPTLTTPIPSSPMPTMSTILTPSSPTPTTPVPSSTTPTTPTSSPSSSISTTPSSNSCVSDNRIHMIPHKTMCDYYYSCFNGRVNPISQKCNRNLLFNPVLRVCDYPENVNCTNIPPSMDIVSSTISPSITTLTSPSSLISPIPTKSIDPSAWVCVPSTNRYKVPHETMCDYYYWCVTGIQGTQPVRCESNLFFNPVVGECDFQENVDCSGRIIPLPDITIITRTITTTEKTTITISTTTITEKTMNTIPTTQTPTAKKTTITTPMVTTVTTELPTTITTEIPKTPRDPNKPREKCPPKGSTEKARIAHKDAIALWVQSCPEPHYFDNVQKICKHKRDAVCGVRFFGQENTFTIVKAVDNDNSLKSLIYGNNKERGIYNNLDPATCIGTCPEEDPEYAVLLPNDDCKKFCMCSGGVAWVQSCPEPLYFDSVQKVCKQKRNAVCGVRFFGQENTFTIVKAVDNDNSLKSLIYGNNKERGIYNNLDPATCIGSCPEEDPEYAVLLPNDDCKKFCMCSGGVAWVQSCPEPLYFDSVQKVCKQKRNAVCGVRFFGQENTFTIVKAVDNDNSLKSLIYGNNKERGIYNNLDPATCIGSCPEEDPEYAVLLPNDDCKKFCMCSGGVAWVQSCPEPLYFDSVQKVCKQKRNAVCGLRFFRQENTFTIVKAVDNDNSLKSLIYGNNKERGIYNNLDPATCIGSCPEEDPEYAVLLPNDDCKKFCMCSGGVAWVQSCPEPLYFDSVQKVCKQKRNAVCGVRFFGQENTFTIVKAVDNDNSLKSLIYGNNKERGIYNNLDPATCIGTCPEEDPEYAVLLPNDDCKKFCMCSGGVAWVQSCPEPLYFDSVQKVCKQKRNAVCGVRFFGQENTFTIVKAVDNDNSLKSSF